MRLIGFVLISALTTVTQVIATLNAKAWQSTSDVPVAADFPEVELLKSKPNTAIGFTGGGSRAFIGSFGILSALHELDLLKYTRYVSGISGGAWATTTFSYAQNVDDSRFLCPIVRPENIIREDLQKMDEQCARRLASKPMSLIALQALKNKTVDGLASAWCYGVSDSYLEPVGITKNTRFSWNAESVADIKKRNPSLVNEKFLLPSNSERPFPLIGTALVGPAEGSPYTIEHQNFTMIEISPLYVGQFKTLDVDYQYNHKLKHTKRVGGTVESFAFARKGNSPLLGLKSDEASGTLRVPEPTQILDLQFAAGASGYAPGAFVESLQPEQLANALGLEMDYWSPADRLPSATNTLFADGGSYENIMLISFLQRRVEKIILFGQYHQALLPASRYNPAVDKYDGTQLSDTLSMFFGVLATDQPKWQNRSYELEKNQVFATKDYAVVVSALQEAQAKGQGIISTHTLTTVENSWWGIPAGITAEITFSYLGRVQEWEGRLPSDIHKLAVPSENAADPSVDVDSGPFKGFPHYFTSGGEINAERANLLADLTGWTVINNAATFRKILS